MEGKPTKHSRQFEETQRLESEQSRVVLDGWIGEMMGEGADKAENGALIVTDRRVVFFRKGWFDNVFHHIDLADIRSVEASSLMGYRVVAVQANDGHQLRFKTFDEPEIFEACCALLRKCCAENQEAEQPSGDGDPVSQLERLEKLWRSGVLDDDEFKTAKSTILSKLK